MSLGYLKKGDVIDIVAPSSGNLGVTADDVRKFVEGLGYVPRIADDFQRKDADLFSSNTKEVRAKHLIDALHAEDSEVLWMFRGGYGATQLIPELEKHDFSSKEKILIGYSDITALGLYFESKYGWKFIHASMLSSFAKEKTDPQEIGIMKKLLSGGWDKIEYNLKPLNKDAEEEICIESKITGGNLALAECSLGTNWQIATQGKILFIEDIYERGYAIDRILEHMRQAKIFDGVTGLIIGDFICAPEPSGETLCDAAISRFIKDLDIPVFGSGDFGHGKINLPLVFNATVKLIGGITPTLVFENEDVYR